ncbi:F-box family protein [Euphorbia peplus]|nr:F-box family protein [Euphorbia peplus]
MSSHHHINEELQIEILKRLPPKSLLKFTSISKSWHSLITNPYFISLHTKHTIISTTSSPKSLLRHYSWPHKQEHYTIHAKNISINLHFPFKSYSQYFQIVGSFNGLICLSDTYRVNSHTIILWNPSIRKFITLPPPTLTLEQIYMFVLGFGYDFDVKVNDYKVVRVVYHMNKRINRVKLVPEVEVYQLWLNSWRRVTLKSHHPHYIISELSLQVYLNGAVHWIGYNPCEVNEFRDLSMVLFDMSREVFNEMRLPESICGLSVLDLSVFSSRNLLSLMQYNRDSRSQWVQYGSCSIWMMKEYGDVGSWSKFFAIDMRGGVGRALGIGNDGEALVVMRSGDLGSYDVESGKVSEVGIKGIMNSFHMEDYVETLSLLDCFNGAY